MSFVFKLPESSGGYCNQLWHLVGYYLVADKKDKVFVLDDSVWNWKCNEGWDDYFSSLNIRRKYISIPTPSSNNPKFNSTGHNRPELNCFTLSQYREAFKSIMVLNSSLQKYKNDVMDILNLKPNNFDAMMIRRGSKLFKESNYISTEQYLNKLIEKDTKVIFLQTDDYNCYEELEDIIKKRKLDIQVYTICPESKRGGQTSYRKELDMIKKDINKSNNVDYIKNFVKKNKCEEEYTSEEMKAHMEEMIIGLEICLSSRFLSTDLQSNVTRMLFARHNNPSNVLNADDSLVPLFNTIMYNPAQKFKYNEKLPKTISTPIKINKSNSIKILSNGDRLGGNLSFHLASIFYAHYYNLPISYGNGNRYRDSIFMKSLDTFINKYNKTANLENMKDFKSFKNYPNWYSTQAQTLLAIKLDYVSYFQKYFYDEIRMNLEKYAEESNYKIPFDPKKTILIHLRLNDVAPGYKGSCRSAWPTGTDETCNNIYRDFIDNNDFNACSRSCEYRQAPINKDKLMELINEAQSKYPDKEVIIVTSPNEKIDLPYKIISNNDVSLDLYLLCNSEVIITSRSTFGFIPLLFGVAKESWVPKWCHFAMFGLTTKYDNNNNINYY